MAFDAVPGGDPRGAWCPKCALPIRDGEPTTIMHFDEDPDGSRGMSGKPWHAECARPFWAGTLNRTIDSLNSLWGRF